MARIRSVRPEFFTSLDVANLSHRARLTWIGLWCYADDEGRGKDDARLVKAAVWPLDDDVTTLEVEADLAELAANGSLTRYEVAGARYFEIPNFKKFQRPNKPTGSNIPNPSGSPPVVVPEHSSLEGFGVVTGAGAPSRYCPRHPEGTSDPCGPCRDARQLRELWDKKQKAPSTPIPPRHDPTSYCTVPGHEHYPDEPPIMPCEACKRERNAA